MSFDFSQLMDKLSEAFSDMSLVQALVFTLLFVAVWFLPTIVALFFNRKHLGKILLANVPAGLSWVAWLALLAWAVTGKMRNKNGAETPAKPSA
ncbi:superinfection immunity protein [Microbulbifer sp.]|uniref:superinfection immunity protein n=1 Tax=Microbulbifer sp. TaxID=1908541 RepID=UPI003F32C4E7